MKSFVFVVMFVLCFGVVSGHGVFWNMDGGAVLSYEKVVDNLNRFPVESYVLGYTYRASDDFKKRCGVVEEFGRVSHGEIKYLDCNRDYYYKWLPYSGCYKKIECYHSAPKGKLFYIRCP